MKTEYNQIKKLGDLHGNSAGQHLQKLAEEFGELAQALNKLCELKSWKKSDTEKNIKENIKEECADSIQCIMVICSRFGFTYEELRRELANKNIDYENDLKDKKWKAKKKTQ